MEVQLKRRSAIGGYWYILRHAKDTKLSTWQLLKVFHDTRKGLKSNNPSTG